MITSSATCETIRTSESVVSSRARNVSQLKAISLSLRSRGSRLWRMERCWSEMKMRYHSRTRSFIALDSLAAAVAADPFTRGGVVRWSKLRCRRMSAARRIASLERILDASDSQNELMHRARTYSRSCFSNSDRDTRRRNSRLQAS